MPASINGIGTKYYGKRDLLEDGSYITTVWVIFIFIPIIPLGSFRVLRTGEGENYIIYNSTGFLAKRVPLCWSQVRNVYLVLLSIVASCFIITRFID